MKARDKYHQKIIEYLGNPDNPIPETRTAIAKDVLKVSLGLMYKVLGVTGIHEAEAEALQIRRARFAGRSSKVDEALFRKAQSGDTTAMKLWYQLMEGWSERYQVTLEPSLEDVRALAEAKGYDPDEFVQTYLRAKEKHAQP